MSIDTWIDDYQKYMTDGPDGGPSITIDDISIEMFGEALGEIERLKQQNQITKLATELILAKGKDPDDMFQWICGVKEAKEKLAERLGD